MWKRPFERPSSATGVVLPPSFPVTGLSLNQWKELLLLQLEHDKFKAEVEKELAVEKMHQSTEQACLDLEQCWFDLVSVLQDYDLGIERPASFFSKSLTVAKQIILSWKKKNIGSGFGFQTLMTILLVVLQ